MNCEGRLFFCQSDLDVITYFMFLYHIIYLDFFVQLFCFFFFLMVNFLLSGLKSKKLDLIFLKVLMVLPNGFDKDTLMFNFCLDPKRGELQETINSYMQVNEVVHTLDFCVHISRQ